MVRLSSRRTWALGIAAAGLAALGAAGATLGVALTNGGSLAVRRCTGSAGRAAEPGQRARPLLAARRDGTSSSTRATTGSAAGPPCPSTSRPARSAGSDRTDADRHRAVPRRQGIAAGCELAGGGGRRTDAGGSRVAGVQPVHHGGTRPESRLGRVDVSIRLRAHRVLQRRLRPRRWISADGVRRARPGRDEPHPGGNGRIDRSRRSREEHCNNRSAARPEVASSFPRQTAVCRSQRSAKNRRARARVRLVVPSAASPHPSSRPASMRSRGRSCRERSPRCPRRRSGCRRSPDRTGRSAPPNDPTDSRSPSTNGSPCVFPWLLARIVTNTSVLPVRGGRFDRLWDSSRGQACRSTETTRIQNPSFILTTAPSLYG